MKKPVVIGIGNSLRRDDGIGCRAARLVEESLAPESAVVIECHQVTPELAAKLAGAPLVVFLDAAVNDVPGRVCSRPVEPDNPGPWSHYLSPGQLLGLAQYINATTPPAVLITGGVFTTEAGDCLSPLGEQCAERMAEMTLRLLADCNREVEEGVLR
jgi:hydrogenase maturation protease